MAKFAQVGYGSEGEGVGESGKGYTYVVNDSVRVGQVLQPVVKHYKNGTIFATTGKVLSAVNETSKSPKAMAIKQNMQEKGIEPTAVETGKELGVKKARGEGGKFVEDTLRETPSGYKLTTYDEVTRALNLKSVQNKIGGEISQGKHTQEAMETYESYSRKYLPKGEQQ